ncbi:MAG: pantoate--beta-alanine ligase [Chloroflexi bacterium]|nr:pantoate--beta-alanine ligase [Chloroflexota bacterium]
MRVIRKTAEMREIRRGISGTVGLVATLGGIHRGHIAHIEFVRPRCDVAVGSLFLNPTQFGPNEDLSRYPSDEPADLARFEEHGIDIAFAPSIDEIYPSRKDEVQRVDPGPVANVLEGAHRPGHFNGVATVVNRLFSIISPDMATFGEKDAQQLRIIQHINKSLNLGVEIIPIPTVRDDDGLALSSRNAYLFPVERQAATVLYRALVATKNLWDTGERNGDVLRGLMADMIDGEPLATIGYVSVANTDTFEELNRATKEARALVAAKIGTTRLIDNLLLN